ncbi:hypothetical protein [Pseudarthrobacter sp. NS4]|uniref:hypothetical protein n=1 Tax=Pseudarthrobacter sp. NS4 TaxID=2973976 RepID=UPI002163517A|nr:hypothetical protein [Pseudarthrobacter sp. NS4]
MAPADPGSSGFASAVPAGAAGVSGPAEAPVAAAAGAEARAGTDEDEDGAVPVGAGAGFAGRAAAGALAAAVLAAGVPAAGALAVEAAGGAALGAGTAVAVGVTVAVIAGRSAGGTAVAETEAVADGLGLAGCLESACLPLLLPAASLPLAFFPPPSWPGASCRAASDLPRSEASAGRACWVAGAAGSPGRGAPSVAWDAGAPVARTSTTPIAAAAEPRRIPPWIPVRDIESSDLC